MSTSPTKNQTVTSCGPSSARVTSRTLLFGTPLNTSHLLEGTCCLANKGSDFNFGSIHSRGPFLARRGRCSRRGHGRQPTTDGHCSPREMVSLYWLPPPVVNRGGASPTVKLTWAGDVPFSGLSCKTKRPHIEVLHL